MTISDLIEWLRAQLDEDERIALAAPGGVYLGDYASEAEGDYALAFDPARVLAEVKAKRAVLEAHDLRQHHCPLPILKHALGQLWDLHDPEPAPVCWTVLLLAQPYAGRQGWQPEWSVGE